MRFTVRLGSAPHNAEKPADRDHAGPSGSRAYFKGAVTRFRTLTRWKALRSTAGTRETTPQEASSWIWPMGSPTCSRRPRV